MRSPQYSVPTTLALVISSLLAPNALAEESEQDTETMIVRSTAEEALKQQPGVSIITAEDIAKQPPVNDLSDIIRKMPGLHLTGNSASGSRGNNRQIDIRGLGPENTQILIDGVPVKSRYAVLY
ncbi:TonB-dependent receptor plug domain-containing protein, partial [Pseudomonas aeruginosa]|nr:TonB-dependent receptor plug domain-containing protein [Pseudomonas aeruginosa]